MIKVLDIAYKYLGYKEAPVNITTFSANFDKYYPDFYNTRKQGAEYCDIYVDYCFVEAYGEELALKLLCQPKKSCGAGCSFSADYYRNNKQFIKRGEGDPREGDQIFFGTYGKESHTGLVTKCDGSKVYTIEGNSSDMVKEHSYTLTSSKISGYGRPDYSLVSDAPVNPTPSKPSYTFPTIPARGYFKQGDKGAEVKKMQIILEAICPGCLPKYGSDGDFGYETFKAVNRVQFTIHVTVDGKYGPKTNETAKTYLTNVK